MQTSVAGKTFGVLGVPIDSVNLSAVLQLIDKSARDRQRLLISTVNANFLMASQHNRRFLKSLIQSDLCTVDGIAVVVLCRMLGHGQVPRASGADILEMLCTRPRSELGRPLRVFFFGGAEGIAEAARQRINRMQSEAVLCVGAIYPAYGTIEELSRPEWIEEINDAHPDVLVLALGAERGQAWLLHNSARLTVPIRTHFGAAVNFLAGSVRRAPKHVQHLGLEWLWRIIEEPALARRYLRDGIDLARLTLSNVMPLALMLSLDRLVLRARLGELRWHIESRNGELAVTLEGSAGVGTINALQQVFEQVLQAEGPVKLDLTGLVTIDLHGMGAVMRLRRDIENQGRALRLVGLQRRVQHRLHLAAARWVA